MAKHNHYTEELKIQIVKRWLAGEKASSLREEFGIHSRGTLYIWKKWYLDGKLSRLANHSGRPSKKELTLTQELAIKNKELELLKKFFLSGKVMTKENIIHFITQHIDTFSIVKMTRLFDLSRSVYYRNRNKDFSALTKVEERIH